MATPIDLNDRRELFVDDHVLDSLVGCRLQLHHPTPAGTVLAYDEPWERGENGSASFFTTVFQDGDLYRMYYRANLEYVCYAESADGIHWVKPELGLVEVEDSSQNNIILDNCQNAFCPLLDAKPGVPSQQRYKANMERDAHSGVPSEKGLNFYASSDGTRFRIIADAPVTPWTIPNHFDSQNVMFWSDVESQYVMYARFMVGKDGQLIDTEDYAYRLEHDIDSIIARDRARGVYIRSTARATSPDCLNWSEFVPMEYSDTDSITPSAQLYTNQTIPYFRADHIYLSLPGRIFFSKLQTKSQHEPSHHSSTGDCSDGVFMTTRAGSHRYDFTFRESFLRPGIGGENWTTRTNYPAHGVIQTGEAEMSIFVQHHYQQPTAHLERMTLRLDGFASLSTGYDGGQAITKPVRYSGDKLELNYSTSAAGGLRVELLDESERPLEGFRLDDCDGLTGDEISRHVSWKGSTDLPTSVGQTVRLRFVMNDADVYSFRFAE